MKYTPFSQWLKVLKNSLNQSLKLVEFFWAILWNHPECKMRQFLGRFFNLNVIFLGWQSIENDAGRSDNKLDRDLWQVIWEHGASRLGMGSLPDHPIHLKIPIAETDLRFFFFPIEFWSLEAILVFKWIFCSRSLTEMQISHWPK